ncbi:MAG TPA: hypothetical protein VFY60_07980, partial [Pyrinomonadaceae bacterium]|nr:hypothetical protein [Pyrinomonadaceae bacterium]
MECGGLAPLCYRYRSIEYQSGARPPHSKEAPDGPDRFMDDDPTAARRYEANQLFHEAYEAQLAH